MNQPLSPPMAKHDRDTIAPDIDSVASSTQSDTLRDAVRATVKEYVLKLDETTPCNLYELLLAEMEPPLLEIVLRYTRSNQTTAAKLLGMSRGTLRMKMKRYGFLKLRKRRQL